MNSRQYEKMMKEALAETLAEFGITDYKSVVLLSSHDHTFMQTVANRVIELTPKGVIDRLMTFDEYLADDRVKSIKAEMYC